MELFSFPNPPERPSYPEAAGLRHLAFEVADIESAAKGLESKGVGTEGGGGADYPGKRFFFMQDPDGLPIEFYEA